MDKKKEHEQRVAKKNLDIAQAKQELAEAEAWLLNVPLDADPLAIVERWAIVNYWPERITRLAQQGR